MRMLFLRRFVGLNGGVLKTFDYLQHARASGLVSPRMMFFPPRPWDRRLQDFVSSEDVVTEPGDPDIVLLSREWDEADSVGLTDGKRPILHLVQHAAHGVANTAENASLSRPATRIVVASGLADGLRQFNPNGRVVVIEAGVDVGRAPQPWASRRWDVTIAGYKSRAIAQEVGALLTKSGRVVNTLTSTIPRRSYLDAVASSRVLVALPFQTGEAAYLAALEAMHLDVALVTPDSGGPRNYCVDQVSCITPRYEAADIARCTDELLANPELLAGIRAGGSAVAARLTLAEERRRFVDLLGELITPHAAAGTGR